MAHASSSNSPSKDQLRVLVGLASEIWYETSDDGIGMAESEVSCIAQPVNMKLTRFRNEQLGKIIVLPVHRKDVNPPSRIGRSLSRSPSTIESLANLEQTEPPFLVALNGADVVEWAEMQMKVLSATYGIYMKADWYLHRHEV